MSDTMNKVGIELDHAREFEIREEHLRLLARARVTWDDSGYSGTPAMNLKRPYGNSDVMGDIFKEVHGGSVEEKLGEEAAEHWYDEEHPELEKLHREMELVVQIALVLTGRGELAEAGSYRKAETYSRTSWYLVPETCEA